MGIPSSNNQNALHIAHSIKKTRLKSAVRELTHPLADGETRTLTHSERNDP